MILEVPVKTYKYILYFNKSPAMTQSPFSSAITYTTIVYLFSFSFVFRLYLHPQSLGIFPFLMLLPAAVALAMRLQEGESLRKILAPLHLNISGTTVLFSILYPITIIYSFTMSGISTIQSYWETST